MGPCVVTLLWTMFRLHEVHLSTVISDTPSPLLGSLKVRGDSASWARTDSGLPCKQQRCRGWGQHLGDTRDLRGLIERVRSSRITGLDGAPLTGAIWAEEGCSIWGLLPHHSRRCTVQGAKRGPGWWTRWATEHEGLRPGCWDPSETWWARGRDRQARRAPGHRLQGPARICASGVVLDDHSVNGTSWHPRSCGHTALDSHPGLRAGSRAGGASLRGIEPLWPQRP